VCVWCGGWLGGEPVFFWFVWCVFVFFCFGFCLVVVCWFSELVVFVGWLSVGVS